MDKWIDAPYGFLMSAADSPFLTTTTLGSHAFPGAWRYMLPEDFQWLRVPRERLATCNACYEVARGEYHDDCRCCMHFPQVPNFMLGFALRDAGSRPYVQAQIEQGHALPQGLVATPLQFRAAVEAYANDRFGKVPSMVCPFVEPSSFNCRIYPYRNSICSTFFCSHDHGEVGGTYWDRVQGFVGLIETVLSQWAMGEVGLPSKEYISRLDAWADRIPETFDTSTKAWSPAVREQLWGDWLDRESDFFRACADVVEGRRTELYELACEQPYLEALVFERGVRDWIPEEIRDDVPYVAEEQGMTEPLPSLWYKLQLANRQLWELPFNEGHVVLSEKATIEVDHLPVHGKNTPFVVRLGDIRLDLSDEDAVLLRLFATAQVLGEALFARPEVEGHDDPRGFLAQCLRSGILVTADR